MSVICDHGCLSEERHANCASCGSVGNGDSLGNLSELFYSEQSLRPMDDSAVPARLAVSRSRGAGWMHAAPRLHGLIQPHRSGTLISRPPLGRSKVRRAKCESSVASRLLRLNTTHPSTHHNSITLSPTFPVRLIFRATPGPPDYSFLPIPRIQRPGQESAVLSPVFHQPRPSSRCSSFYYNYLLTFLTHPRTAISGVPWIRNANNWYPHHD